MSERVVLVGERPLAQAVKSFEHADPITLPEINLVPLIPDEDKTFISGSLVLDLRI